MTGAATTVVTIGHLTIGHAVTVTGQHVVVTTQHVTTGHFIGHAVGQAVGHAVAHVVAGHALVHEDVAQLVDCAHVVAGHAVAHVVAVVAGQDVLDVIAVLPYICPDTPATANSERVTNTARIAKILFLIFTSFSSKFEICISKLCLNLFLCGQITSLLNPQ